MVNMVLMYIFITDNCCWCAVQWTQILHEHLLYRTLFEYVVGFGKVFFYVLSRSPWNVRTLWFPPICIFFQLYTPFVSVRISFSLQPGLRVATPFWMSVPLGFVNDPSHAGWFTKCNARFSSVSTTKRSFGNGYILIAKLYSLLENCVSWINAAARATFGIEYSHLKSVFIMNSMWRDEKAHSRKSNKMCRLVSSPMALNKSWSAALIVSSEFVAAGANRMKLSSRCTLAIVWANKLLLQVRTEGP